jgi:hypothetical protein
VSQDVEGVAQGRALLEAEEVDESEAADSMQSAVENEEDSIEAIAPRRRTIHLLSDVPCS